MDYNNFINRSLISISFLFIYIILSFYNFQYILYLIYIIFIVIFIEVYLNFKKYKLLIFTYLLSSLICISFSEISLNKFNLMIITVISFDIFSYIIGINFGKRKLLKIISPNKTIEGFLGGIIFSFIISLLYIYLFNTRINAITLIFISVLIISSFVGDIIESIFKRINNIKNSSNYLPGHGGFFDRFDSFIFCIFPYTLISY